MYSNTQTGQAAASTAAPLSAHRRALLDLLASAQVITTAEYDTAVSRILDCQELATLQKWYRNTIREIAAREEAQPIAEPTVYATTSQKEEIIRLANYHTISRPEKTKALLTINELSEAQAKQVIAGLWAKLVSRASYPTPPADGWSVGADGNLSYSTAA